MTIARSDLAVDTRPDLVTTTYEFDTVTPADRLDWWRNLMPSYSLFIATTVAEPTSMGGYDRPQPRPRELASGRRAARSVAAAAHP